MSSRRTLVICEKPFAARRIAQALDEDGSPTSYSDRRVPYYIAYRGDEELVVVTALGHLFNVAQREGEWNYPVFDIKWAPAYEVDKGLSRTRKFIDVIREQSREADHFVSACDYDMEGSLIAYMVLRHVFGEESLEKARRMRFSTLTEEDLVKAWEEKSETLDFPLIEAGKARHEIDWLFGINLSRALTLSVKNTSGFYRTLSIGRVQGPTLNFIREKEIKVNTFVPLPFWTIKARTKIGSKRYDLEYEKPRLETLDEAEEVVGSCRMKEGLVSVSQIRTQRRPPPPPFNIGDLQREAYQKFKYAPRTTLNAAERLYLEALISYPRTSSQRLPLTIDLIGILDGLKSVEAYRDLAERLTAKPPLRPRQGSKDDPAHPAIHPTGKKPGRLSRVDRRIFDLVCRRFMASLGDHAIIESVDVEVEVGDHLFHMRGSRILEKGWHVFYAPYIRTKEVPVPDMNEGQGVPIDGIEAVEGYTKPPPRLNSGSLLKLMEDEEVGTKSTRSDIIDTLFKRGYISGNLIEMTDLGLTITESLSRHVPEILSLEMTRSLERDLEAVQDKVLAGEAVVEKVVEWLEPVLREFKAQEDVIGAEIDRSLRREAQRSRILGPCPVCRTGDITLIHNRKTGKRFAGCSNYSRGLCDVSYPLPQEGKIEATGKSCSECGAPIVKVTRKGRRPWDLCLNVDCPTKKRG